MLKFIEYAIIVGVVIHFIPFLRAPFIFVLSFCFIIKIIIGKSKIKNDKNVPNNKYVNVDFDSMTGVQFEQFFANILKDNGYSDVNITKSSGDHGIDILATKDEKRFAIQCKCYSGNVGNKAVQEVFSGRVIYNADVGAVITNRYFTKQAIEDASALGIELWDRNTLLDFIKSANGITKKKEIADKRKINEELHKIEVYAAECNHYLEQKDYMEKLFGNRSTEQIKLLAKEMANKIVGVFARFGISVIIENIEINNDSIYFFLKPGKGVRVKTILSFKRDVHLAIKDTIEMVITPEKGCIKIVAHNIY